jgi:hypothetical protein
MNDTILACNLFFGAFTTIMNSWLIWGAIFNVICFYSSLDNGFSINQQLNSISEFLIKLPSLYEKGNSSLLYYPKIESQLKLIYLDILIVTTYSFSL